MEILSQNKFSSLGMLLGAIALVLGMVHFSFGPFSSPPPSLEMVVAEQVAAVKKGIIAGITGKTPATAENRTLDVDRLIHNGGIVLAIAGLGLAFIGGMRKENRWGIRGAMTFAGETLIFHTVLFGIGVVCAILVLMVILSIVSGALPSI
ncbi:hypothetical protein AAHB66_11545 [Leclercia sp. S52]|uniref:hypothetical protein n=1 Tax=Leclercia sp. S52 TaxID=3138178 RepID=UPI003219B69E